MKIAFCSVVNQYNPRHEVGFVRGLLAGRVIVFSWNSPQVFTVIMNSTHHKTSGNKFPHHLCLGVGKFTEHPVKPGTAFTYECRMCILFHKILKQVSPTLVSPAIGATLQTFFFLSVLITELFPTLG